MPEQLKEVLRGYLNEYRDLQSKANDIDAHLALTREEREILDYFYLKGVTGCQIRLKR